MGVGRKEILWYLWVGWLRSYAWFFFKKNSCLDRDKRKVFLSSVWFIYVCVCMCNSIGVRIYIKLLNSRVEGREGLIPFFFSLYVCVIYVCMYVCVSRV
jgi:hypothetical protein